MHETTALRTRRYRERRKAGIRCVRLWFSELAFAGLEERRFLAPGAREEAHTVDAIYTMLEAAWDAGVTRD